MAVAPDQKATNVIAEKDSFDDSNDQEFRGSPGFVFDRFQLKFETLELEMNCSRFSNDGSNMPVVFHEVKKLIQFLLGLG